MAKTVSLQVSQRAQIGRRALKAVRKAGRVPGVLYGKTKGQTVRSRPIEIDANKLKALLHSSTSENVLVDVELTDEKGAKVDQHLALLLDVQHDPLEDYIVHIDLHEIDQDEILHAEVPVTSTGEPVGVKNSGGLLETMLRTIRVACLPRDLPDRITIDVSGLDLGQSIHVREVKLPANVTATNPPELPVFTVFAPKEEVVEAPTTEITQPEVIKEKKVEGEVPAADAKGAAKPDAKAAAKPEGKK
ncbi:MAG: 50S ribosomal protein L25 [Methylacidiphilales bacterium]|nr:50S ribosomal protein L25 [Candidatus Methylacidiphilales bacterium]